MPSCLPDRPACALRQGLHGAGHRCQGDGDKLFRNSMEVMMDGLLQVANGANASKTAGSALPQYVDSMTSALRARGQGCIM